jgi:hypothetical protein
LALKQKYQAVTGTFRNGGKALPISSGRLRGEAIRFTAGGAEYRARVDGNVIEGTVVANGAVRPWKATRHSP